MQGIIFIFLLFHQTHIFIAILYTTNYINKIEANEVLIKINLCFAQFLMNSSLLQ